MTQGSSTTEQIRELIIYQTIQLGWKTDQVSVALKLNPRTVQRIVKRYKETGATSMDPSELIGRPKIMSQTHIKVLPFLNPCTCHSSLFS